MTTLNEGPSRVAADGFTGTVLREGDDGYDAARAVWNGMFDRRPAVILRCQTADDVASALVIARESGREVAVRSGGHSLSGQSTTAGAS
jgi:FAD/FMN-containing dehydrogenase